MKFTASSLNNLKNQKGGLHYQFQFLKILGLEMNFVQFTVFLFLQQKVLLPQCKVVLGSKHLNNGLQWNVVNVGSVVEWLKHRTDDQHGLASKPTCAILLCIWERHFTVFSPAWWSWQAVLNYSNISTKLLADSNILASPEAGRGNCLPYV